jgi:hypothetical protein
MIHNPNDAELQRLPTLLPPSEAISVENIPEYPKWRYKLAKGGEMTYEIQKDSIFADRPFIWQGFAGYVPVVGRKAKKGEKLKDSTLKYEMEWSENMLFRLTVLKNAEGNQAYQQLQIELCRSSILYFVNTFCFTYDPRLPGKKTVPFVTFGFQDEVIEWMVWLLKTNQTGLIEKSRDMGASWMAMVVSAWLTLFYPEMTDYFMSMTEPEVDSGGPDSLFGKLRILLRNLPKWMTQGWREGKNGCDNKMKLRIPATRGEIVGKLTQGTAGRSGRGTRVVNDETAFVDNMNEVAAAQGELANSFLYMSTPNGPQGLFFEMATSPHTLKKTLHWSRHPLKNQDWAKYKRSQPYYTDEKWAQEQECNYESSTMGRVFKHFISSYAEAEENEVWCHAQKGNYFDYDERYPVYCGMDLGVADPTSVVFGQLKPPPVEWHPVTNKDMLVIFDEEEAANLLAKDWAKILHDKGYRYALTVADMYMGNQRDSAGTTWFKNLKAAGVDVKGKRSPEDTTLMKMSQKLASPAEFVVNSRQCPNLVKAFQGWSYPVDRETGKPIPGAKPKHDEFSHQMKAILYLVDYMFDDTQFIGVQKAYKPKYRPLKKISML